jgi:hypothetical protein
MDLTATTGLTIVITIGGTATTIGAITERKGPEYCSGLF